MKSKLIYPFFITLFVVLISCDENEVMPSYTTKHTSVTHTMATLSVSHESPAQLQEVTVTLSYVNSTAEPLKTVALQAKVGDGAYAEIQSWDVSQDPKDVVHTKTIVYQVPAAGKVDIALDMVITSFKEFPQIKRFVLKVQE